MGDRRGWTGRAGADVHTAAAGLGGAGRFVPPLRAHTELATAIGMLREMGMAFWLPEAERELAET